MTDHSAANSDRGESTVEPGADSGPGLLSLFAAAAIVATASLPLVRAAAGLWRLCRTHPTLPLWDEAAHGVAGVEVSDAIRHLHPLELILALNRQVVWPFVHSLLLAPAFLLFGNGFATAEAVSVALFLGLVLALFAAGSALHPRRGAVTGIAAASLALLAPSVHVFGTLAMLEVPGALLLTLAFALHARAAAEPLSPGRLRLAGITSAALFLCKYNYGLLWLAPLALWEWRRLPEEFRARAAAAVRRRMTRRWWLRPMPLLFAAGALAIAAILATGGGEFRAFGQRVSVRSPGNLAYALWLVLWLWLLVPRRGRESRARWIWARLHERARIHAASCALPIAIWLTLPWPNRMKELFGFLANRDSGLPLWSREGLLFYPRAWIADYSPSLWIGAAVITLALWKPPGWLESSEESGPEGRAATRAASLARLALGIGLAATLLHRYRDSRFLFTVAPLIWLCASSNAVSILDAVLRRSRAMVAREAAWIGVAVALLAVAWNAAPRPRDLAPRREALRGPASVEAAADGVLDMISPRQVAPHFTYAAIGEGPPAGSVAPGRAVLLGYSNVLSPGLLAWRARAARPELAPRLLPKRAPYLAPGAEDAAVEARVRWLEERADQVIVALADSLPSAIAGEYAREVWADRETGARLAESPNWEREREARLEHWWIVAFRRAR
jgi:hypothetical protein